MLIAEFRWRRLALRRLVHVTHAAWQAVTDMWQKTSSRIAETECTHPPELRVRRANQWALMDVCDRKRGGGGAILDYSPTTVVRREKQRTRRKQKTKDFGNISQRAALIVNGGLDEKEGDNVKVRPRASCVADRCRTNHALSRMEPRWDAVYIDQGVSRRGRQLQREKYQPYRRRKFATGSGGPHSEYVASTERWIPKSNSQQRLDSSDANLDVQPRVGARTIRSVAAPSTTLPTSSVSAAARSIIQPGVVAGVPSPRQKRQVRRGPVDHGYANGSDRYVDAQSSTRTDVLNHESDQCVESQPNLKNQRRIFAGASPISGDLFELQRKDKIPGLAAMILERGVWPRDGLCSVFWAPAGAKDSSHEFRT